MTPGQSITARASCRVDLAGGTLDLWPLYLYHHGAVTVNFALDIFTTCKITSTKTPRIRLKSLDTDREDTFTDLISFMKAKSYKHGLAGHLTRFFFRNHWEDYKGGFSIETNSESPAGAGISGSSALMIATTAALAKLTGRKLGKEEIRVIAQNVEAQLIKVPTGCQDYYPALYGGVSAIHLSADGIHRDAVEVDADEINSRFVLVYTGAPRQSGINNWEVFKAHINGDKKVWKNFEDISAIAQAMHRALSANDWREVAKLLRAEWKLRRTNAPGITTPLIDKLIAAAEKNGGLAAKVCGAGGGGCVVFNVEPGTKARVEKGLAAAGGTVLPFRLAVGGLNVRVSN